MKKTLLVLALIVFFIPVTTFAKDVPPGQPFQQLQDQINTINSQVENLAKQLQNIGNKTTIHDNVIDQLTTSVEKLSTQASALGVTHVIHGRSSWDGQRLAGENWTPVSQGVNSCGYYEYVISLDSLSTDPTAPAPHCVVVPSYNQTDDAICVDAYYDGYPHSIMRVDTYNAGMVEPIWILSVQMRYWWTFFDQRPYQAQFDFICVQ